MKPKQKDDVIGSMEGEGLPEVDGKLKVSHILEPI